MPQGQGAGAVSFEKDKTRGTVFWGAGWGPKYELDCNIWPCYSPEQERIEKLIWEIRMNFLTVRVATLTQ